MSMLANLEAIEGTVEEQETFDLQFKSRKLIITNDSATKSLKYRFNNSSAFATLFGTESISMYFTTKTITLKGINVPYRIWVYG